MMKMRRTGEVLSVSTSNFQSGIIYDAEGDYYANLLDEKSTVKPEA